MQTVYLTRPELKHKQSYIEMMDEWKNSKSCIYPGAIRLKNINYSDWLKLVDSYKSEETCPPHLVPSDTFFLVNTADNILGAISIRHYLSNPLLKYGGHIGYGIRPSERKKGYATLMLKLSLEFCKDIGLKQVLITCNTDNIASKKTILKCGGDLENTIIDEDGNAIERYWINLNI